MNPGKFPHTLSELARLERFGRSICLDVLVRRRSSVAYGHGALVSHHIHNYQIQYQVTFVASPSAGGAITVGGQPASTAWYDNGAMVSIQANSNAGYVFSGSSSDAGSITFTNSSSRSTTADTAETFGIEIEIAYHETALGQNEIDFKYNEALTTADRTVTMKMVAKAGAARIGICCDTRSLRGKWRDALESCKHHARQPRSCVCLPVRLVGKIGGACGQVCSRRLRGQRQTHREQAGGSRVRSSRRL